MDRYPREYENNLATWLENHDLDDTPENREAFEDDLVSQAEEAEQRWLEYGGYDKPKPLNPWDAYLEEMQ